MGTAFSCDKHAFGDCRSKHCASNLAELGIVDGWELRVKVVLYCTLHAKNECSASSGNDLISTGFDSDGVIAMPYCRDTLPIASQRTNANTKLRGERKQQMVCASSLANIAK